MSVLKRRLEHHFSITIQEHRIHGVQCDISADSNIFVLHCVVIEPSGNASFFDTTGSPVPTGNLLAQQSQATTACRAVSMLPGGMAFDD